MLLTHKKTQKKAALLSNQVPTGAFISVIIPKNLPSIKFWEENFNLPPEIIAQGKAALDNYLRQLIRGDAVYYIQFFASLFPDGQLPPLGIGGDE